MLLENTIKKKIRFFKAGFGDILPVLGDPKLRNRIISRLSAWLVSLEVMKEEYKIDRIVGIESRGAMLGAMLATANNLPFSVIRRGGALPIELCPIRENFIDYSKKEKSLESCKAHFRRGERVIVVDDWFETGQSAAAAAKILEQCGVKIIGFCGIVNSTKKYPFAKKFFSFHALFTLVNIEV